MISKPIFYTFVITSLFALVMPPQSEAQWGRWDRGDRYQEPERDIFPGNSFTFCRLIYNTHGGRGWGRGGPNTDYPDSDLNFSQRLGELTSIEINKTPEGKIQHVRLRITDEELFNYPFAYMIEPGSLFFTEEDAETLRQYLLRGGFLLVDDFWGRREWNNFYFEFSKVFPPDEYPMIDIPKDHPIFNIVFKLDGVPQVPGIGSWQHRGDTGECEDGSPCNASARGVFDKTGRLICVVLHNTDLGDGWEEEAKNPHYFREFSAKKAYPLGINIIVYAMTH